MPEPKSQADIIRHAEGLLDAAERTAQRQEVTQKLKGAIGRVKDSSIAFRSVVRGKLGPRSERVVHFKIAPLRKRSRRPVVVEVEKKLNGEAPGTKPDASASPSTKPVV